MALATSAVVLAACGQAAPERRADSGSPVHGAIVGAPPWPVRVEVAPTSIQLPPESLDRVVSASLSRRALLAWAKTSEPAAPGALSARVWFHQEPSSDEQGPELQVALELQAPADLEEAIGSPHVEAVVRFTRPSDAEARDPDEDFRRALALAFDIVEARLATGRGDPADIHRLLAAQEPQVRGVALEWVAETKARDYLADVRDSLMHDDLSVHLQALAALAEVGSEADVPFVLDHLRLFHDAAARATYECLGRLGGEQAREFLSFAASNDEDKDRRALARRALRSPGAPAPVEVVASKGSLRGHRN